MLSNQNRDQIMTGRILKEKKAILETNLNLQKGVSFASEILILQRKLGHDNEFMFQPSNWECDELNEKQCWVCNRQIYSLVFWNESIGALK